MSPRSHRLLGTLGTLICLSLAVPTAATAATCSDYSNQAEAQRAADTRDADGDGIYCEALPCPCARPGASSPRPRPRPAPRPRPRPKPTRQRAQVIRARIIEVIDGDTVRVRAFGARRSTYTVRLLGIDTPETRKPGTPIECGGKEATAALLVLSFTEPTDSDGDGILDQEGGVGRRVTLTTDPTQDTFDRFRRLLAYVETLDGAQLNVSQIAAGWSETYVFERRFRQYGRFRAG